MLNPAKNLLATATAIVVSTGLSKADVVIAVAGPMTGQYAVFGEQMRKGARQAVKDLNAEGGVIGERLLLRIGDDAYDPSHATAVAERLVNAGAVFIAGHFCSGSSIPASPIYNDEGVLQISPASTNPRLTEQGFDNVFRVSGRDDEQGVIAADYVIERELGERIAVVHDGSRYGRVVAKAFRRELKERGAQELLRAVVAAGQTDFTGLINRMKRLRIDLVYFSGYHPEAALLIRQAHGRGLEIQLVSGDALVTDDFWRIAGPAGQGTLLTFAPDPRKHRAAASVVREFQGQGFDPEGYTLYTYAAVQVWAQAVEAAGTIDLDPVVERLRAGRFKTVLGAVRFDAKGDVRGPSYILYRWSDGRLEEVGRRVRRAHRRGLPNRSPAQDGRGRALHRKRSPHSGSGVEQVARRLLQRPLVRLRLDARHG